MKKHPIERLIEHGEGLHLDFKFEVSDAAKISRSLVAFANTEGGKLLIGVKDNGVIKGIRSEEELYMIENAAKHYCKPEVKFTGKEWNIKGKKVLEVSIPVSKQKPHRATDKDGKYKVFFRYNDENLLASGVQVKIWKKFNSNQNISVTIDGDFEWLLKYLNDFKTITVNGFRNYAGISRHLAEEILSDLVVLDIIKIKVIKSEQVFELK